MPQQKEGYHEQNGGVAWNDNPYYGKDWEKAMKWWKGWMWSRVDMHKHQGVVNADRLEKIARLLED